MKIILVLLFSIASWGNSLPSVNPKQFSGLWYEIARTYNEYEKKCVASTVEYTLKSTDNMDHE